MKWFEIFIWLFRVSYTTVIFYYLSNIYVLFPFIDSKLEPYFDQNLEEVQSYCDPSQYHLPFMRSVQFGRTEGDVIAYCEYKRNGYVLVFNRGFWDTLTEVNKKQLMMHEMVHCLFRQEHFTTPFHFMYYQFVSIPENILNSQTAEYLFRKCLFR